MPHARTRLLLAPFLMAVFWLTSLCPVIATASDEELIVLTIEGDLIGKIESLDDANSSDLIISAYYDLLTEIVRIEIASLRSQLSALIPDYEVAFTAADSAELTQVKSDIDELWAGIQTLHAQYFTPEVVKLLIEAYDSAFSSIGLENSTTKL